jgi:hypothetical protein
MSKRKTLTIDSPETRYLAEAAVEIRRLGKQTVANVIDIGRHLVEAKKIVGHGNWLPWLEREFGWHENTALNFMRVFDLSKTTPVVDLNLPLKSLYLLAAPSTPEAARKEIIAHAEKGEKVKVEDVKGAIRATRPASKQPARRLKHTNPDCPDCGGNGYFNGGDSGRCHCHGVSQVSTAPEKRASGLPNSEVMPTAEEAEESYQETLYDQACLLLESMARETRQRFFVHIKENYYPKRAAP